MNDEEPLRLTLLVATADGLVARALSSPGRVAVGRGDANDVQVNDESISRHHAVLHIDALGNARVEDLGSANGTNVLPRISGRAETANAILLNGKSRDLAPGDRIVVGGATLVVRREAPQKISEQRVVVDPRMRELHAELERAAESSISVLLLGETGVGKEVLARYLHAASPRVRGPFVAVNCAALTESLLEAELFGHEKGAFTGALQTRTGLFEAADRGTLFLDEIGETSLATQAKLLRVLEERVVVRIGGQMPRKVDVRFIAATNRDLEAACDAREFRSDLYFRLAGLTASIPPLRERPSEVLPLARSFLERACSELERVGLELSDSAITTLTAYDWPGNVRELRNAMQRAAVLCRGYQVLVEHLPERVQRGARAAVPAHAEPAAGRAQERDLADLRAEMRDVDRERILKALERCAGNQTRAAEELGMSRRTLVKRLGQYNLPRPRRNS